MSEYEHKPVMYYDGECGLCATSVQWCLNRDRKGVLLFAPIQGDSYANIEDPSKPVDISTMVIHDQGRLFIKSSAVLRMLQLIGGFWAMFGYLGMICPRFIRDVVYDFVAKRRISWFGEAKFCQLPTPAQRARFLD
jgi:predicted DCC family thiol-disulfide oxidoreductase YuxK